MNVAVMSHPGARSLLGFLTVVGLFGPACSGGQLSPDGSTSMPDHCANVGCAAPPMCSTGCTATCGCCLCSPGERTGDLVCTAQGCYAPAPASDGGTGAPDAVTDGPSDAAHDVVTDHPRDAAADGWTPAAACALPFEAGVCLAAIPVYAFVEGVCVQRTYGGCGGNDNRFSSWEECVAACLAPPLPGSCPPNRVDREVCVACGAAGGCGKTAKVCALVCDPGDGGAAVCPRELPNCTQGVCQYTMCI